MLFKIETSELENHKSIVLIESWFNSWLQKVMQKT